MRPTTGFTQTLSKKLKEMKLVYFKTSVSVSSNVTTVTEVGLVSACSAVNQKVFLTKCKVQTVESFTTGSELRRLISKVFTETRRTFEPKITVCGFQSPPPVMNDGQWAMRGDTDANKSFGLNHLRAQRRQLAHITATKKKNPVVNSF